MKVPRCKGSCDLLPRDMARFRHIERVFSDCCLNRGYEEVKTPTLEYLHLFTAARTLTPSMLSHVYSFLDWDGWSGGRVVLRPDGTIPAARLYIENLGKYYCVGNKGEHLKLKLQDGRFAKVTWDAIGFDLGYLNNSLTPYLDIVYNLEKDNWRGEFLRLNLLDLSPIELS